MLEGVRYIARERIFFATIGLSFFTSIFGLSYVILLPIFADEILNAGVTGFGYMEAAAGVGAGRTPPVFLKPGDEVIAYLFGAAVGLEVRQ